MIGVNPPRDGEIARSMKHRRSEREKEKGEKKKKGKLPHEDQ